MPYTVQMWLTCSHMTPEVLAQFAKRWTSTLQSSWSAISCTSSTLGDLADELNQRIETDLMTLIAQDVGGEMEEEVDCIEAFSSEGWIPGNGGSHAGTHTIYAMPEEGGGVPWSFWVGSTKVYVSVSAQFQASQA